MMSNSLTQTKKRGLAGWSTRDLLVTVMLGLAIGLVTIPLRMITTSLNVLFGPLASVPASAYVVLAGIFVAYVVRRPLAAAVSQIIAGLVLTVLVPGGFLVVALYLIHAIAIELPFALTRYKRYEKWFLAIAGGIARLIILATAWIPAALGDLAPIVQIGLLIGAFIGGAIGGLLAKVLADSLARAGVFSIGDLDEEDEELETAV